MRYSNSVADTTARATKAWAKARQICVLLADGREIRFPVTKNRRLAKASAAELANIEVICNGTGLHWPDLDEDLSVQGIMEGRLGSG